MIWIHGHRHWFYIVKFDLFKNKEKMMSTSAAWMILIILFGDDWLESRNSLFKGRLCLSICVYIFIKKIMLSFMFILLFFYIFIKLSHILTKFVTIKRSSMSSSSNGDRVYLQRYFDTQVSNAQVRVYVINNLRFNKR